MPQSVRSFFDVVVPDHEMEFTFVRSSGPGGQNVNKVNSKAVLRWNIPRSAVLGENRRTRLLQRLASRLTREGDLLIACDEFRDQPRNREACIEKLHTLVRDALREERPRKPTKPTRSSQRRKREDKGRQSEKKRLRRSRSDF